MKALVGTFNQEKALVVVGALSVIVKLCVIFGNLSFKLYWGLVLPNLLSPFFTLHIHTTMESRHTQLLGGGVRGIRLEYNREGTMINLYLLLFDIIHII